MMNINKYICKLCLTLLTLPLLMVALSSCQDEDFGYTQEDVFKGAYARNFIKAFGPIDPNENWDFSQFGRRHVDGALTRAGETPYIVSDVLRDKLLRGTLAEGINHFDPELTFCFLSGNDHFTLTPIYRSGTATDWSLHLAVFTPDATSPVDITVWSSANENVLDIMTDHCTICDGRGYVPSSAEAQYKGDAEPCPRCIEGYISSAICDLCKGDGKNDGENCPQCGGAGTYTWDSSDPHALCEVCNEDGKVESGTCETCNGAKTFQCSACNGQGYKEVAEKGGAKRYYQCDVCGNGADIFGKALKKKDLKQQTNQNTLNSNKSDGNYKCSTCNGTGIGLANCSRCGGDKHLYKCPVCDGSNVVYKCKSDMHNSDTWIPITGTSPTTTDTKNATAIKGYSVSTETLLSSILSNGVIPTGTIFYFYLQAGSNISTSMDGGMREFLPTDLGLGSDVKIIGCEEGDGDNDFNDVVFLLQGPTKVIHTQEEAAFTTHIMKRYMAEDFGSNSDWDFNDIVIDVDRKIVQKLTKKAGSSKDLQKAKIDEVTTATITYLCGTAPIQATVGTTQFNTISDPTDFDYSLAELTGDLTDVTRSEESQKSIGWKINFTKAVEGWNPDANNVTIAVKRDWNNSETETINSGSWHATFPTPGTVPFIIATDVTVAYVEEDGQSFDFSTLVKPSTTSPYQR